VGKLAPERLNHSGF